jgi:steroid delta-isomerase-like uncharacterized protein
LIKNEASLVLVVINNKKTRKGKFMKRSYFPYCISFFLLLFISSCKENGENNSQVSREKDVVYKAMYAFDKGDAAMMDSLAASDFVEHQVDSAHTKARGLDAVKEIMNAFHKAIPDLKTKVYAVAATGDTVMVYSTMTGTWKDSLMGMPPTNSSVSFPGVDVFRVNNGKIAEHWGFADMNSMQQIMSQSNVSNEKMQNKHK